MIFESKGFLTWQAYGKDQYVEISRHKKFTCRSASEGVLDCDAKESRHVQYDVEVSRLNIFKIEGSEITDLIKDTNSFYPCTKADEEWFK